MDFNNILNWKLLAGSHEFPGPDGGTCINEAAMVAAGFEYKAVGSVRDLPKCFSQDIAKFAMQLNDVSPDGLRQRLIKYVCRLAGSADVYSVEHRRNELKEQILDGYLRDVLMSSEMRERAFTRLRENCTSILGSYRPSEVVFYLLTELRMMPSNILTANFTIDGYLSESDFVPVSYQARDILIEKLFNGCLKALDAMLAVGNQAQPIETATVQKRFEQIKEKVNASVS